VAGRAARRREQQAEQAARRTAEQKAAEAEARAAGAIRITAGATVEAEEEVKGVEEVAG